MFFPVLFVIVICHRAMHIASSNCPTPAPGLCRTNNSDHTEDREVFSPNCLNCQFDYDLCSYRQGCFDDKISNWTAEDGYAFANSSSQSACGGLEYSILESRWVNFTTPSCIQFTFARYTPAALEVFHAHFDGTATTTILDRTKNNQSNGGNQTVRYVVSEGTGKLKFRLYGGGGVTGGVSRPLKLCCVTHSRGDCSAPETTLPVQTTTSSTTRQGSCPRNGVSPTQSTTVKTSVSTTTGRTTVVTYTTVSSVSESTNSNGHQTSSETLPSEGSTGMQAGNSNGGSSGAVIGGVVAAVVVIAVVVVVVVITVRRRRAETKGGDATKGETEKSKYVELGNSQPNQPNNYTEVRSSTFLPSAPPIEDDYTDIDGVTSNPRHSDVNPYDLAEDGAPGKTRRSTGDYSHVKQPGPTTTTTTTSVMMSEESVEGDYSVVDVDDSYSLAKIIVTDEYRVPSKKRNQAASADEYSTVNKPGHKPSAAPEPGQQEGDYNIITHHRQQMSSAGKGRDETADPYNIPESFGAAKPGAHGTKPTGNRGKVSKPDHKPAVAPKPGKEEDDYNTITHNRQKPTGNHSKVGKPDHKPAVAPKPGKQEDDYNTITRNRQEPAAVEEGRDATTNPYNLPQSNSTAAPFGSAVSAGEGRETTDTEGDYSTVDDDLAHSVSPNKEMDSPADCYCILEPDPTMGDAGDNGGQTNRAGFEEDVDDYNRLNFDEARKQSARHGEVPHNTYDHVHIEPDDDYSTAHIGKRNVVIDSDYDHIKR